MYQRSGISEYTDGIMTTNTEIKPIHIFLYALYPIIVAIIIRKIIEQYKQIVFFTIFYPPLF